MVDPQNNKIEVKPKNNSPCINFTNMKDHEQPQVSGNMIDKNVLFSITFFPESSNFLHPCDKMSNSLNLIVSNLIFMIQYLHGWKNHI